jgi:hypothetical protein
MVRNWERENFWLKSKVRKGLENLSGTVFWDKIEAWKKFEIDSFTFAFAKIEGQKNVCDNFTCKNFERYGFLIEIEGQKSCVRQF